MAFTRVRELIRKEFIQLFRDKRNRPLLIIAPLLQLTIFGYVVTTDVRDIRVGFFDQSRSRESRLLIDAFNANKTFRITNYLNNPRDLEELLLAGKIDLGIKVGPNFSSQISKKQAAGIQILVDGTMSNMASMRIAYTLSALNRLNQSLIKELYPQKIEYGKIDLNVRTWYNPNLYSHNFYVPGIVAFLIMLVTLLFTSLAVIKEREAGTMEQLIVTPVRPLELIFGKTVPYAAIALGQMAIISVFAIFWFEIPFNGNVILLFIGALLFIMSTLGLGLFISTISATQQQAMMTTFFFILPFFMLSGFVFPIENMPIVVQWLTYLNPLRYFLVIIRGIFLKGVGLNILFPQYLALTALGAIVFTGAVKRFRKRLD